jgi:hypothetical protein
MPAEDAAPPRFAGNGQPGEAPPPDDARVDALEAEVAALKAETAALRAEIAELTRLVLGS